MPLPSYLYSCNKFCMNKTILLLLLSSLFAARPSSAQTTAILGAYGEEITLLLKAVENKKETVIDRLHFTEGTLHGRKVVVALTGIGKVNAAITTIIAIDH